MGPMNAKLFVAVIVMTSPDLDDIAQIILSINVIGPRKESRGVGSRDPRHSELEGVESGVDMLTNSNDEPLGQPVAEPANLPNARQIPRILSFLDGHKRRPSLAYIQALGSTCHRYDAACLNWQEVRFLQEIQNSASVTLSEFLGQALYKNGGFGTAQNSKA
ncbi:uncharacterized protein N7500_007853 [Penicillium coprophilum]|uniref:uncharacterized protein n=1 Tax=Penicillium coprophilum TaxID=36646 RepID=UPI00238D374B|nr:uncharacterized protein N7500_007853 [Penicillium coprophilum]KAJ5158202.1 hypothetical protein N7500_007853 [Penicillium coprophilum]